MTAALRTSGTKTTKSGGSGTIVSSISALAGDFVVCGIALNEFTTGTTWTLPAGWDGFLWVASATGSMTYRPHAGITYKFVTSSGTLTNTLTTLGSDSYGYSQCVAFTGLTALDIGLEADNANGTATSVTMGPTGTIAVADSLALAICTAETGGGGTGSFSTPASPGFTSIFNNPNDSAIIACDFSYKILSAIGTVSAAYTWSGAARYNGGVAVVSGTSGGGGGPTINDHNFRATGRGVGLGIGRGIAYAPHPRLSLAAYYRERAQQHRDFIDKVRRAA